MHVRVGGKERAQVPAAHASVIVFACQRLRAELAVTGLPEML